MTLPRSIFYIAGNGPSLDMDRLTGNLDATLIVTNRLIWCSEVINLGDSIYACGDMRFLDSEAWISEVRSLGPRTYLADALKAALDKLGPNSSKVIDWSANDVIRNFRTRFIAPSDLLHNVVLDVAVPVAIALGATDIRLFGCDFTYGDIREKAPSYWGGYEGRGLRFDHSPKSADAWAEYSQHRFVEMVHWLNECGIDLSRDPESP